MAQTTDERRGFTIPRHPDVADMFSAIVLELHADPGHGPTLAARVSIDKCPMQMCVMWRRFDADRLPDPAIDGGR